jgi:hypothetical protein
MYMLVVRIFSYLLGTLFRRQNKSMFVRKVGSSILPPLYFSRVAILGAKSSALGTS